jgi:methylmalonyl-CoA/ethylmalonyl-CoA epimerase
MKIKRIHHVAMAVNDMAPLEHFFGAMLGLEPPHRETRPASNLEIAIVPVADSAIELLKPNGPGSSVPDFIASRGEGLFHVCFEVEDIDAAMAELRGKGLRFRTESALPGHAGTRIAFLDPATTGGVLFELLESPAGETLAH